MRKAGIWKVFVILIVQDEIINATDIVSTNVANTISTNIMSTVSVNSDDKK